MTQEQTRTMFGILSRLFGRSGNDESTNEQYLGGADAVIEALLERTDDGLSFQITFSEPRLVDRGAVTEDLWVVIPTSTENGPDPANVEFNLPRGFEDLTAELYEFMDRFGIEKKADLGDLEGVTVPSKYESGSIVPDLEAVSPE